ncbi:MAG: hypothetical protein IPJ65_16975 [Archangiaceae bacterium]|nr:hypothetical protein [Archangiaceae bacterium]
MAVRIEQRGPFAIYRFERGPTRVTLELPAFVPPPLPEKHEELPPAPLPPRRRRSMRRSRAH